MTLLDLSRLDAQRAVEALRSGVPNREAVAVLGCAQPQVEERFWQQLEAVPASLEGGKQPPGLLIAGDFGTGKSHLLEYLERVALSQNFVCSRVVISKETPLYDAAKLYRAAVESAVAPGRQGVALTEIAASLDTAGLAYAELERWAASSQSGLSSRFPATLHLYRQVRDPEIQHRLVSLWAGDPLNVSQMRAWLRAQGDAAMFPLESVPEKQVPYQRFRFLPRLMVAAGYAGWVLLVDEVELIGRYSFKRRAQAYAELARWAGRLEGQTYPGLATAFAITADFDTAVLQDRNDVEAIPGKLRASEREADKLLAAQAEHGMRLIRRDVVRLRGLDRQALDEARERVRALHARAYDWDPPTLQDGERLTTTRMRQHVRRWINEWDLRRLYPGEAVDTVVNRIELSYTEDRELEAPEGDGAADERADPLQ